MQKNKRNFFRTDLRQPLIGCAIVGLVALLLTVGIFIILPTWAVNLLGHVTEGLAGALP